jgi:hypothetical protein
MYDIIKITLHLFSTFITGTYMKSIFFIITSLFFLFFPIYLNANEFIISNKIVIKQHSPNQIAHSGELVIFKYEDWSYTHEVILPDKFIVSVDLTGFEHQFVEGIFDPKKRKKLPNWMSLLAENFSKKILNKKGEYQKKSVGEAIVYGTYNAQEQQGFIFILEKNSIHKLDILGINDKYTHFINNITKRN